MFHFYMIINFSLLLTMSVRYIRVIAQKFVFTNFLLSNLVLNESINFSQLLRFWNVFIFFGNRFRNVNDIKWNGITSRLKWETTVMKFTVKNAWSVTTNITLVSTRSFPITFKEGLKEDISKQFFERPERE